MHGITKTITFTITAERSTDGIYALADIPIQFSEWDISNPSVAGFVTTANSGTLEVLVHLVKGAGNPEKITQAPQPGGGAPVTVPSTTVPNLKIP